MIDRNKEIKEQKIISEFLKNASIEEKNRVYNDLTVNNISIELIVENIKNGKYTIEENYSESSVSIISNFIKYSPNIVSEFEDDLANGIDLNIIAHKIQNNMYSEMKKRR